MAMTLEQQRAIALAKARQNAAQAQQGTQGGLPSIEELRAIEPGGGNIGDLIGEVAGEWGRYIKETPERVITFGENAINAVPVIGPAITGGMQEGAAQLRSGVRGEDIGTARENVQQQAAGRGNRFREAQVAGQLTGTIAPLVAAGSTGLGAKLLGGSGGLGSRVGFGLGSGAVLAGADTAARGGNLANVLMNTAAGGALGAGAPLVGAGVRGVAAALRGERVSPAARMLARDLEADRIPVGDVTRRLSDMGPEAVIADLGENVRGRAGALAASGGPQQTAIRSTLTERQQNASRRITSMLEDVLGPSKTPSAVSKEIKDAKKALSPLYEDAFNNASRVDTTAISETLEQMAVTKRGAAQEAAKKIQEILRVPGTDQLDPDPRVLHEVRMAIDGMYSETLDGNVKRLLLDVRKGIDDTLASSVPGIKAIDAQYAELSGQQGAFERGQQVLGSGRKTPRPAELADEFGAASPGQQMRMSQGARDEIERIVGTNANDVSALNRLIKGEGDWNRERLVTLFGKEKADRIFSVVERERAFADTANTIMRNSETARRQQMLSEMDDKGVQLVRPGTTLVDLLMKPVQAGVNLGTRMQSDAVKQSLAEALMSRGDPALMRELGLASAARGQSTVPAGAYPLLVQALMGDQ